MRLCLTILSSLTLLCSSQAFALDEDIIITPNRLGGGDTLVVTAPAGGKPDARTAGLLRTKVSLDFQDVEMDQIADFFHRTVGLNIVIDPKIEALPVSLKVNDMSTERALNWIATQANVTLSYINEAVYFSNEPAKGAKITKVYDVTDLTAPLRSFPGPSLKVPEPGSGTAVLPIPSEPEVPRTDVEELAEIIEEALGQ